jgi:hypothetical protein
MILGITGTTRGTTPAQHEKLRAIMRANRATDLDRGFTDVHHGDAIGVDLQAHVIALFMKQDSDTGLPYITIHPPVNDSKRAFCKGADIICEPEEYLARDREIARCCDVLIAVPLTADEQLRSGTWATVRYARKLRRLIIIIDPDGTDHVDTTVAS